MGVLDPAGSQNGMINMKNEIIFVATVRVTNRNGPYPGAQITIPSEMVKNEGVTYRVTMERIV